MLNKSANIKQGGHCYVERIGKHQAGRSLLCWKNWQTSSTTVIDTSTELENIQHDGHCYVERIDKHYCYAERVTKTSKKSRSMRKICIHTHRPLWAHKPYTYAKAALHTKYVFVHTRRLDHTSRTRTQKPFTLRKSQTTYAHPYNLRTQTAAAVSNKLTFFLKDSLYAAIRTSLHKSIVIGQSQES